MDSNLHVSYSLEDKSYIGILKREIRQNGQEIGLNEEEIGKCHIIISEMATNLIKYALPGREILIKTINNDNLKGLEFISVDRGPGIADIRTMSRDSISTSGTLGQGLGAIKRLSNNFDIYSLPGSGTIILSRVFNQTGSLENKLPFLDIGAIRMAMPGQVYCGDNWTYSFKNKSVYVFVFDGLGHGIHAQEASHQAIEIFKSSNNFKSPADILKKIHNNIKKTRGGVGCIIKVDNNLKTFTFCGVGNIACKTILHGDNKSFISFNGILGMNISRLSDRVGEWSNNNFFILHSDGVKENWNLNQYPGLLTHDPTLIAAVLYRDFSRQRDDVSIVIGKNKK